MELSGRHVVITGGGTGVGAALAQSFAGAGAAVTIMGRRRELLEKVADQTNALAQACDVTDRTSINAALNRARAAHGPVTVAIANAGVARSAPFKTTTLEALNEALAVNLTGTFSLWQATLSDMTESGWGRMIAIASTAGLKGYRYVGAYCAAKHAVVGLTRSIAVELGSTLVTVNAICPGYVETPMLERTVDNIVEQTGMTRDQVRAKLTSTNPQARFLQAGEVASAALWLCSEGARSVNGHALSISGGEV
ncbi:MAG: SDR family NAD(P)-dependent oxidoreductase [Pseudomonadota bacterium]